MVIRTGCGGQTSTGDDYNIFGATKSFLESGCGIAHGFVRLDMRTTSRSVAILEVYWRKQVQVLSGDNGKTRDESLRKG